MSKKRLKTIVVIDNLHAGGVATSLYNYLLFTQNRQDCDLLVFNEKSINRSCIPNNVRVLKTQRILHILGMFHKEIKKDSLLLTFIRLVMIFVARKFNGVLARNIIWPFVKTTGKYDLALAYAQDDSWHSISKGCIDFVVKKTIAKKKAVIVHCDYSNFGGYDKGQLVMFSELDYIINVSQSCKNSFDKCFPSLQDRSIVCENFIDIDGVNKKADPPAKYDSNRITFVIVCRLGEEKALERPILATKRLIDDGFKSFSLVIVGGGPEEQRLKDLIKDNDLEAYVVMVGQKTNPYPFIKTASWFLLTSRHEAAPMVFGESAALQVPIITTETCSAREMVEDKGWGIVVDNSENGVYEGMRKVLTKLYKRESYIISPNRINEKALDQFNCFEDIISDEI